ncbi:Regulatory protein AfsR [Dolichospermum sp. UHCC 0315A]|jgi:CHAT domain-containing protein/Tfp pilus assembly protein PilF|uniref:CHAT domain-containing protein n=1 Tax=Dolichospermum sp. UHCC 0315A TaxID=1914871 RepID=UPI0011E69C54|nr:CHAT domain-containing tetratricopeptide repeat protein [Dolichospermum sp. UHCC 0315A]QEI42976.1 Regulatory protein AfsR [Dolichospermum sp. UHCC 0315A]
MVKNQQHNWLLSGLKHPYLVFGIGFLLCCGVCVDSTRVLAKDDLGKIAQSSTAKTDNAERLFNEGMKLYQQGTADSLRQAIKKWEEALSLYRLLDDKKGQAISLNNIGEVYKDLGEKQKALKYFNEARLLYIAEGDKKGQASVLNNIGEVYSALGKKQDALKYYKEALHLSRAEGDKKREATSLNNIGRIYSALEKKQDALYYYKLALLLRRAESDKKGEAISLNNIGGIYSALREKEEALKYYKQALPLRRAEGDKKGEANTLNNIGGVYSALGEKQKALESYNEALLLRRTIGDKYGEATTLNNIGAVYRDTKQPNEAIKYLEQSVTITLQIRSSLDRENRKTFLESKLGRAVALIDLLIDQNQPERAFEWANLATVADLADYSRLVNAKVADPEVQKAIDQWNQKNLQLESLRKQLSQKVSQKLSQEVNQLQTELNKKAEEIRNRSVEVAELFETKPTDIAQLRANIPAGTTVIQPVLLIKKKNVPNTIPLFLLTKDKLKAIKIPIDPAKFDSLLTNTYTSLTNRYTTNYLNSLQPLYDLLIRPIETEIAATKPKQISIIATGKLRYIPFEALHNGNEYLIEKYPISYLTRLSSRSLQTKPSTSNQKILAVGNPIPRPPLALKGAEDEVKSIIPIFPGTQIFIKSQATLANFKSQIPRFSLLHLATHGCFQKGGCKKLGLKENTLLFADTKFNIQDAALLGLKNVDLITLSGCQTALKADSNGTEISGLAYLFERAGSKAVIASLWSAADEETKEIMVQFYQNLQKGMRKDEALRQAKLSQINNNVHPYFWSPFVLIGDGR